MIYDYTHLTTRKPLSLKDRISRLFHANATYNYRGGYPLGTNYGTVNWPDSFNVAEIILDFAKMGTKRTELGMANLAPGDILELFALVPGTWVQSVFAETQTMEGEAATINIGDGVTPAGYLTGFDANVLGFGHSLVTTPYSVAVGGGKVYNVADTIDVVLNTAAFNAAKVRIMVALVDLRQQRM